MNIWLDAGDCSEKFHEFEERDGRLLLLHADSKECLKSEYGRSALVGTSGGNGGQYHIPSKPWIVSRD